MASGVLLLVTRPPSKGLGKAAREGFAVAAKLAAELNEELSCAVVGEHIDAAVNEAAERGAVSLLLLSDSALSAPGDTLTAAVAEAARTTDPRVVIVPRGPDVLELAPRMAIRLGGASVTGVTEARANSGGIEAVATVFGGAARAVYRFTANGPAVIGMAPVLLEPPERSASRDTRKFIIDIPVIEERVVIIEPALDVETSRIEDARVVVSGGRGLGESENFELIRTLALSLGGMPGASRAIVDDGWAIPSEQVGLTGAIVTPDVYVAAGISGASQHMAGCSNARVIVAINTDRDAPIFRYAHFGIVDDCLEVLPELIRLRPEVSTSE